MRRCAIVLLLTSLLSVPVLAGQWLTPDWQGQEVNFQPVPLYWSLVREQPLVYRTVIDVPPGVTRAVALLRTADYAYVHVDGRQVFAWAPTKSSQDKPGIPADPQRVHEVDLGALTPGRHVLTVSAPAKGFVLDGGLYQGSRRVAPLASTSAWTVTKFRPTTILEDQTIFTPAYDGRAVPDHAGPAARTSAGEAWSAPADALSAAYARALAARLAAELGDAAWQLDLLTRKGLYIDDQTAWGWAGPLLIDPPAMARARALGDQAAQLAARVEALGKDLPATEAAVNGRLPEMARLETDVRELSVAVAAVSRSVADADERKALELASKVVTVNFAQAPTLPQWRQALESALGHPLNRLSESRYDRLGWIRYGRLTDSRVGSWGVRINPVTGPTTVTVPRRWLFATDPNDVGERELRWSIGYNVEGQMGRMDAPGDWARSQNANLAAYKGAAWYRNRVVIPDEWAGQDVVLKFRVGGQERVWINDEEITRLGTTEGTMRVYTVPSKLISYGGENFLALRIDARGDKRGILSAVTASAPSLEGQAARTPPVDVLATPLSPCAVLTVRTDTMEIHHGGQGRLLLPGAARPDAQGYDARADGKLKANWALLWLSPASAAGVERPILLVFQNNPVSIACRPGLTSVKLAGPGQRIIAVRPWAKLDPTRDTAQIDLAGTIDLWRRAALAVPVNYMNITRVLRPGQPYEDISIDNMVAGPLLGHTVVYDYLQTEDQWGTEPLKIAPLPALCSYAVDMDFRNLVLDQSAQVVPLQDGGLAAPYRGIVGADRVSYQYDVEPWPRMAGFTSFMFTGVDTGVPGNVRELETLASTGANSYRPQHNFSEERPPANVWPAGETRSRVEIIVDICNAVGMNYTNNIDERLGGSADRVTNHYDEFMELVTQHYEKIARQVGDRPFWAVAYDLINEGFHHKAVNYNPWMKKLTARLRQIDKRHLCYIEPVESWGAIQKLDVIRPTGDPLTMYSFHDYNFRLKQASDRWPTAGADISSIYHMWWPAFRFAIQYGYGMHCGEFGGHHEPTDDSLAQKTLQNDFFKIFDQFGMHHHYYSGRGVFRRQADGSLRPSNVIYAYREYFSRPDFNMYYRPWPGTPRPAGG